MNMNKFTGKVLLFSTALGLLSAPVFSQTDESKFLIFKRSNDMKAAAKEARPAGMPGNAHGGVGNTTEPRWAYYAVPQTAASPFIPEQWRPVNRSGGTRVNYELSSSGDKTAGSHNLSVYLDGMSYYWNVSSKVPASEFGEKGYLLMVFTAPRQAVYNLRGDLLWRLGNAPNSGGASLIVGLLPDGVSKAEILFQQDLVEKGAPFENLRPVPNFTDNPKLQTLKLNKGDRLIFALRCIGSNHRILLLNDVSLRIVTDLPAEPGTETEDVKFTDGFFDSKGVNIHYVTAGTGPPVILVHGWSMDLKQNWIDSLIMEELAQHNYYAIAMDCRGLGKSGRPIRVEDYGMEMVDDIARLMDHLKLTKAHVVGFSMGAFITWRFEMSNPQRTLSATHIDIPLPGPGDKGRQQCCEDAAKRYEAGKNPAAAACQRGFEAWAVTETEAKACQIPTMLVRGTKKPAAKESWPDWHSRIVPNLLLVYLPDANNHFECFQSQGFIDQLLIFIANPAIANGGKNK